MNKISWGAMLGWLIILIQAAQQGDTKTMAVMLSTILVVAVVQLSKRYLGIRGPALEWIGFGISLAVSAGLLFVAGEIPAVDMPINDPITFLGGLLAVATTIFAFSTVVWKAAKDKVPGFESVSKMR